MRNLIPVLALVLIGCGPFPECDGDYVTCGVGCTAVCYDASGLPNPNPTCTANVPDCPEDGDLVCICPE